MKIPTKIQASIVGFNGQKTCDSTSVNTFLNSYIFRKEKLISNLKTYSQKHNLNEKQTDKLSWWENSLAYMKENYYSKEVRTLILNLMKNSKIVPYRKDVSKKICPLCKQLLHTTAFKPEDLRTVI